MPFKVTCPLCQAQMMVTGQPVPDAKIKCPGGGHVFRFKAGAPTPLPTPDLTPRPDETRVPQIRRSGMSPALGIGIIAAILLAAGGIIAAILLTRGEPAGDKKDSEAEAVAAAKAEQDRLEKARAEYERSVKERDDKERAAKERADKERIDRDKAEQDRIARAQADKEREQRQQDFIRYMIDGGSALSGKKYDDAVTAYAAAAKLFPESPDVIQKLAEAQAAQAALARGQQDDAQRKQGLAKLVGQAQDAMVKKQYAAAVELFKVALQIAPGDTTISRGLTDAQAALGKDQEEQKKIARFEAHISAGRAAMSSGNFADALRDFAAAQQIFPFSPLAAQLQRQAEDRMIAVKDKELRAKDMTRLLELGALAMTARRFDEAEFHYTQALKLMPKDPSAMQGVATARQARTAMQIDFERLMGLGNNAARDGRFRDAVDYFREAVRTFPGNELALRALADAERLQEARRVYTFSMRRGTLALEKSQYRDAVIAFSEALSLVPNDPLARDGLADAQRRLDAENRNLKDFERRVLVGVKALKAQRYTEARDAFNDALKLMPNHAQAPTLTRQARYADSMGQGTTAMNQKRYGDAVRDFQAALFEVPNDPVAQNLLTRARALNKGKS